MRVAKVKATRFVSILIVISRYCRARFLVVDRWNLCGHVLFDSRVLDLVCSWRHLTGLVKFRFSLACRLNYV